MLHCLNPSGYRANAIESQQVKPCCAQGDHHAGTIAAVAVSTLAELRVTDPVPAAQEEKLRLLGRFFRKLLGTTRESAPRTGAVHLASPAENLLGRGRSQFKRQGRAREGSQASHLNACSLPSQSPCRQTLNQPWLIPHQQAVQVWHANVAPHRYEGLNELEAGLEFPDLQLQLAEIWAGWGANDGLPGGTHA